MMQYEYQLLFYKESRVLHTKESGRWLRNKKKLQSVTVTFDDHVRVYVCMIKSKKTKDFNLLPFMSAQCSLLEFSSSNPNTMSLIKPKLKHKKKN